MTSTPRWSRYPVTSFGPELMALLIKGSTERVKVECESFKELQYLQMRIHMLRAAMKREKHPQLEIVQRARTSRGWAKGSAPNVKAPPFVLTVEPHDLRFKSAIEKAGVTIEEKVMTDLLSDKSDTTGTPVDPSTEPTHDETTADPYGAFKGT